MLPKIEIKRKEKFENLKISNFMPAVTEKYLRMNPKENKENIDILDIYKKAVGEEIFSISRVLTCENGVLTIKVKTAVWKNELKFREEEIKNSINSQNLQKNRHLQIKKIIFK